MELVWGRPIFILIIFISISDFHTWALFLYLNNLHFDNVDELSLFFVQELWEHCDPDSEAGAGAHLFLLALQGLGGGRSFKLLKISFDIDFRAGHLWLFVLVH